MRRWNSEKTIYYEPMEKDAVAPLTGGPRTAPWEEIAQGPRGSATFSEATRTGPARAATVESDVAVTALQALISGIIAGALALALSLLLVLPLEVVAIAAVAVGGVTWFFLLFDSRALLRQVERVVGRDLDGDGQVGPVEGAGLSLHIDYQEKDGSHRYRRLDLPAWLDLLAFRTWAQAGINGLPISEKEWTPKARAFSTTEYRQLMAILEDKGVIEKVHPDAENSRRRLTAYGRSVLREFVTSPLPDQ